MHDEREHEQGEEDDTQGVLVELKRPTTFTHCPGDVGAHVFAVTSVIRVLHLRVVRLSRTSLEEDSGKHDVKTHLQELALPVLEEGFDDASASQILGVANRRSPMLLLGAVVVQEAKDALRGHKDEEVAEH